MFSFDPWLSSSCWFASEKINWIDSNNMIRNKWEWTWTQQQYISMLLTLAKINLSRQLDFSCCYDIYPPQVLNLSKSPHCHGNHITWIYFFFKCFRPLLQNYSLILKYFSYPSQNWIYQRLNICLDNVPCYLYDMGNIPDYFYDMVNVSDYLYDLDNISMYCWNWWYLK